uniref:Uncharacterized protein n=1 Tax=Proboscia inermis TaxID=420281 RepID=A0A7S0CI93_9STRA|mmetsp:Transcript_48504/g.48862  ORF Transcript_48504/g.48862 Transcript_48504/m.48862 type:complete len:134 (+) Transcript_48504:349-750(+)
MIATTFSHTIPLTHITSHLSTIMDQMFLLAQSINMARYTQLNPSNVSPRAKFYAQNTPLAPSSKLTPAPPPLVLKPKTSGWNHLGLTPPYPTHLFDAIFQRDNSILHLNLLQLDASSNVHPATPSVHFAILPI